MDALLSETREDDEAPIAYNRAPPQRRDKGALIAMATEKQRAAAKRNVRKAQAAAKKHRTLK